jgi:hypothetical protein
MKVFAISIFPISMLNNEHYSPADTKIQELSKIKSFDNEENIEVFDFLDIKCILFFISLCLTAIAFVLDKINKSKWIFFLFAPGKGKSSKRDLDNNEVDLNKSFFISAYLIMIIF